MPFWPVVIVFAVLASCAVVVIAGYFRGNRKIREAAAAAATAPAVPADLSAAREGPGDPGDPVRPRRDEPPTESWIWG